MKSLVTMFAFSVKSKIVDLPILAHVASVPVVWISINGIVLFFFNLVNSDLYNSSLSLV